MSERTKILYKQGVGGKKPFFIKYECDIHTDGIIVEASDACDAGERCLAELGQVKLMEVHEV
jgi:hypothetical protein